MQRMPGKSIACLTLILLGWSITCSSVQAADTTEPVAGKTDAWKPGKQTELNGVKISLSQPVLVARRHGFLWFPTLTRLTNGDLLAIMSSYADEHTETSIAYYSWSSDGGLTWSKPVASAYCEAPLTLANGDTVLLPYYMRPAGDRVMTAPYILIPKGKQQAILKNDGVRVSGWERPDRSPDPKLKLSGFVFNGQTQQLKDGKYVATLYGNYKDTKRYALVLAESADGRDWKIRSTIADENCPLEGVEGPCESALCRLQDGRLMSIFRNASNVPFGQAFSSDEGKTWTKAVSMPGVFSVQPSLQTMPDGTVYLSGGRPGMYLWRNGDKEGRTWESVDMRANHNEFVKNELITDPGKHSSNYTEIIPVDDTHLLYIYDRIPHSWNPIPKNSQDTNSVWVVRVTIEKK